LEKPPFWREEHTKLTDEGAPGHAVVCPENSTEGPVPAFEIRIDIALICKDQRVRAFAPGAGPVSKRSLQRGKAVRPDESPDGPQGIEEIRSVCLRYKALRGHLDSKVDRFRRRASDIDVDLLLFFPIKLASPFPSPVGEEAISSLACGEIVIHQAEVVGKGKDA
jgi:hypothetical protein